MANKFDLGLSYNDSLFSTQKTREDALSEKVTKINIEDISDFKDHPFHVQLDEDMVKLIDSIKENGLLMPALVRPTKDGKYEMVSGHRRKFALDYLGKTDIEVIVRDLDDDQATILMVDSNIQREHISPTEKGYAFKMRLDAMKHQGKFIEETTCTQVGYKSKNKKSIQVLSEQIGESRNQVQRYIRLTYLNKELQDMVDGIRKDGIVMAFNPAVELSYLNKEEQDMLVASIIEYASTPSLAQCQELKRHSQQGDLTEEIIDSIVSNEKPNQKEKISLRGEDVNKYFPRNYTPKQKRDLIIKLLDNWCSKNKSRDER